MRAPVTVITASIPGREEMLGECVKSVYEQTVQTTAHLVMAQDLSDGLRGQVHCAIQQSWLLPAVTTEFTMRLADDDMLLPHHIETYLPHLANADVVYSWDAGGSRPRMDCNGWPQERVLDTMEHGNWIDGSAVAIRTDLLRKVGGWPTEFEGNCFVGTRAGFEDWAVFVLLARVGARFLCVPEVTWQYRMGPWARISCGG